MITRIINKNLYKLDMLNTKGNYKVFQLSLLDRYAPSNAGQPPLELEPSITDDPTEQEWELERNFDCKLCYLKIHLLAQWAGDSHVDTSWQPAENLQNALELVDNCHRAHQEKPPRKCIEFHTVDAEEMN